MNTKNVLGTMLVLITMSGVASALSVADARTLCSEAGDDFVVGTASWNGETFVTQEGSFDFTITVTGTPSEIAFQTDKRVHTILAIEADGSQTINPEDLSGSIKAAGSGITDVAFCVVNTKGGADNHSTARHSETANEPTSENLNIQSDHQGDENEDEQEEVPQEVPEFSTLIAGFVAAAGIGLVVARRR